MFSSVGSAGRQAKAVFLLESLYTWAARKVFPAPREDLFWEITLQTHTEVCVLEDPMFI